MEVREASAAYAVTATPQEAKGYKQTEVGVIPEDWDVMPLIQAVSRYIDYRGRTPKKLGLDWGGGDILALSANNVQMGRIDPDKEAYLGTEELYKKWMVQGECEQGDVLLTMEAPLGNVAQIPGSRKYILSQRVLLIKPKDWLLRDFLAHYMKGSFFQNELLLNSTGSTAKGIQRRKLDDIEVYFPPTKAEQEAIAQALSDADALIESLEQLLAKKRYLKQGAMQELLTGKKRLPGFSGEWGVKRLGETATLKARIGWQGLTTAEYLDTGDYYLVTGTEFKNGYIDWNSCHYVDASRYKQDKYIQLKEHDVLVTKDGTIGKVALITDLPRPATLNSGVFVIRPIENAFHPEFFYYLLCSNVFTEFLTQLSAGSTINHLYQKDFVSFVYRTPASIREQIAIANIFADMDAELAMLEAKLTKARSLKQGMMQELLTGRIRLVQPASSVVPFPEKAQPTPANTGSHNKQINEAVIIGVLSKHFGTEKYPLPRKRRVKLTYLLHRYTEGKAEGYLKKAAGPYDPGTKYKGPETIALKNGYVRAHHNGSYPGFVAGDKIVQAENYFEKWYGSDALAWLEQFKFKKTDELELLATVDMAMVDLAGEGRTIDLLSVKAVIAGHPEWVPKLSRENFSDANIARAIRTCQGLFG